MPDKPLFKKEDRMFAWKILKEEGLASLPIDPMYFIKKYEIQLWSYTVYSEKCECSIEEIEEEYDEDGFLLLFHGKFIIVYNGTRNKARIRWTIMHEICHFLLGHVTEQMPVILRSHSARQKLDIEADNLVSRLFCPSAVVHMCAVSSVKELSNLCGISITAAKYRFEHLQKIRKKDRFLVIPEEKEIITQFAPFICSYLCKKLENL